MPSKAKRDIKRASKKTVALVKKGISLGKKGREIYQREKPAILAGLKEYKAVKQASVM